MRTRGFHKYFFVDQFVIWNAKKSKKVIMLTLFFIQIKLGLLCISQQLYAKSTYLNLVKHFFIFIYNEV